MPGDLIARLRSTANLTPFARLLMEAADQIEALQLENRQQRALIRSSGQEINRLRDCLIPLPNVKLEDQWGNSYPAYTKAPELPEEPS